MFTRITTLSLTAFLAAMLGNVRSAYTQSAVIAESGDWRAFKFNASCLIGSGNEDSLGLIYFVENDTFALDIRSEMPWMFSERAAPAIAIRSRGRLVFSRDDGRLSDNILQFSLSRNEAETLTGEIAEGNLLLVQFPGSTKEGGWINLNGSRPVVSAFARCINELRTDKAAGADALQRSPRQTFAMTFDAFRKALDEKIRFDSIDKGRPDSNTTSICRKTSMNSYSCNFNDAGFQAAVSNFKKLDVMSGHFALKLRLDAETAESNISLITLTGDRSDPVNWMQFVSTVWNIMQVFDPTVGLRDEEFKRITEELGLLGGAVNIGEQHSIIEPFAVVQCLSQDHKITTHVECQFVPRS